MFAVNEQSLNSIVAYVNNDVITQTQLDNAINMVKHQLAENHDNFPTNKLLRHQVLQNLIDMRLQLQKAKQAGMKVDNASLDNALNRIATSNHMTVSQLQHAVIAQGVSYEHYKNNIRNQILIAKLQQAAVGPTITVEKSDVLKLLKQNGEKTLKLYHVKDILIPLTAKPTASELQSAKQKTLDIISKLNKGTSFSTAAFANSIGQSAIQGGDLGWRPLSDLPQVFSAKLTSMKVGQISGPIQAANGFHIIKLVNVKTEQNQGKLTFKQAQQLVYSRKMVEASQKWLNELRSSSYIKIIN